MRLTRPTWTILDRLRLVMLAVAVLGVLSLDLARPSVGLAKDVDVTGTVECGIPSGQRCDVGDTLVLLTDSVTGVNEPIPIDISWIKKKLPALDQDDEITLSVELLPNGVLKALSVISAKKRDGTVNQGLSTATKDVMESRRDRGEQQDEDTNVVRPSEGGVSGRVVNELTGAPIPGATVRLNGFTATTDAAGGFSLGGIPPGSYQVEASAPGFTSQTQPVTIQTTGTAQLTFFLETAFPNLTFTLVWGAQPPDLDAHLSGPATPAPPSRFHAFFLDPNPETYVSLTVDDQDGFGPERIVVRRDPATNQYVAGDYHFWVDNPNGPPVGPNYTGSQARVIVNRDGQLLGVFDVSAATGDPNLRLWHVVNVQIDAAGNATVQPVQQFTSGDNFVVLSPSYGPKPPRR